MARPKSLWLQVNSPERFRFAGWENVVGNKRCFHLVGFAEVLRQMGFRTRPDFLGKNSKIPDEVANSVVTSVPDEWKQEYGAGDPRRQKEWEHFSVAQVIDCYAGQPALLSKAMMCLLFLELLVSHLDRERKAQGKRSLVLDIYSIIRLEPAVYWVQGFNTEFHDDFLNAKLENRARRDDLLARLVKASGQPRARVFIEIARDNRTCLYKTAEAIIDVFSSTPEIGNKVEVEVFRTRQKQPPSTEELANFDGEIPPIED